MESVRAAALTAERFHDRPDAGGSVIWTGNVQGLTVLTKLEFAGAGTGIEISKQRLGRVVVRVGRETQIRRIGERSFDQLPQAFRTRLDKVLAPPKSRQEISISSRAHHAAEGALDSHASGVDEKQSDSNGLTQLSGEYHGTLPVSPDGIRNQGLVDGPRPGRRMKVEIGQSSSRCRCPHGFAPRTSLSSLHGNLSLPLPLIDGHQSPSHSPA